MREVYLDNSATTRTDPDVAEVALERMTASYGNPSSLHAKGTEAHLLLERARGQLANALGCEPGEVYFTAGGTEANNLALLGAFGAHRRRASGIVSGKTEHASVLAPLARLKEQGADITLAGSLPDGCADPEELLAAVGESSLLLSCGLVNGELGGIAPIAEIAKAAKAKAPRLLLHCDAIQALGKLPVSVKKLGVDLLSVSGHKLHAPKGIGALYIRRGVRIHPLLFGGGQEQGMRPGTESLPLACAFGAAAEKMTGQITQTLERFENLREYFVKRAQAMAGLCINSPPQAAPYICNISAPGFPGQPMLRFLAERGVYVSTGSACAKGKESHVLSAVGLPPERIQSALRVSLCKDNTIEDLDAFFTALEQGRNHLARSRL